MSASPISMIPVAPAQEPSSASKQADNDSSGESFNQALTREMSERRDAAQTSDSSRPAAPADQKPADKAAKSDKDQQIADKDKDADKADAADTTAASSAGMLAFMIDVRQLSGKGSPADKTDASSGKPATAATDAVTNLVTTGKALPVKVDATAVDEKLAGAQGEEKKTADASDARGSSKTKNFAEDLRGAGKDARQTSGEAAKAEARNAGIQNIVDARMEALQKAASEHERTLEVHASPTAAANLIAAQQVAGLHTPAAAGSTLSPQIGTPAWDRALGQKIVWMVAGDQQSASLTLNPPDLGPLQVVLNVSNSTADATFIAAHPEARHALEQAIPKLREMMNEAGIQLGQANVNTGTPNGNHAPRDNFPAPSRGAGTSVDASGSTTARVVRSQPVVTGQGLIDTFV